MQTFTEMKGTLFFGPFFFFFFFVLFSFWSAEARITTHSIGPTRSRRHIGGGRRWKNISPSLRLISFYVYHVDLFVLSQICPLRMYHTSKTRESGRKSVSFSPSYFYFSWFAAPFKSWAGSCSHIFSLYVFPFFGPFIHFGKPCTIILF